MQGAETVYEFGSSPDEDDDNNETGRKSTSSPYKYTKKKHTNSQQSQAISSSHHHHHHHHHHQQQQQQQQLSNIANPISDDQLLLNEAKLNTLNATGLTGGGSSSLLPAGGPASIGNISNTSLSSTTNSSRGNISQSGNQSLSVSTQKGIGPTTSSSSSSQQQNPNFDSNVISERVKNLATQIYQELKRIISRCNYDEDILSGLMPLIVRVLESLDLALIENQQLQVEVELCKDDNEQLVVMFEKEKAAKRAIDKKLIESEYAYEEERQQYQQKIDSLDNMVKMYELKTKNASDQGKFISCITKLTTVQC